jgi:hypothetical protein
MGRNTSRSKPACREQWQKLLDYFNDALGSSSAGKRRD